MTLYEIFKTKFPTPPALHHRNKLGKRIAKKAAESNIPVVLKEQTETFLVADYPESFAEEMELIVANYFIENANKRRQDLLNQQKNLEAKAAKEKEEQERLLKKEQEKAPPKKERPKIPATKVYDSRKKTLNPRSI